MLVTCLVFGLLSGTSQAIYEPGATSRRGGGLESRSSGSRDREGPTRPDSIGDKRAYQEVHAIKNRFKEAHSLAVALSIVQGPEPEGFNSRATTISRQSNAEDRRDPRANLDRIIDLLTVNINNWKEVQRVVNGKKQLVRSFCSP